MPLELSMTTEEQALITATPVTPAGHPVVLDGDVTFTVSDGTCTLVKVSGLSAQIVSGDIPGDSTIMVEADADLGAGVEKVMDTILAHVMHANASSLGLVAGAPELKPA